MFHIKSALFGLTLGAIGTGVYFFATLSQSPQPSVVQAKPPVKDYLITDDKGIKIASIIQAPLSISKEPFFSANPNKVVGYELSEPVENNKDITFSIKDGKYTIVNNSKFPQYVFLRRDAYEVENGLTVDSTRQTVIPLGGVIVMPGKAVTTNFKLDFTEGDKSFQEIVKGISATREMKDM